MKYLALRSCQSVQEIREASQYVMSEWGINLYLSLFLLKTFQ